MSVFKARLTYSSGLSSGLYGGRKNSSIRSLCASAQALTALLLWALRLSTIKKSEAEGRSQACDSGSRWGMFFSSFNAKMTELGSRCSLFLRRTPTAGACRRKTAERRQNFGARPAGTKAMPPSLLQRTFWARAAPKSL